MHQFCSSKKEYVRPWRRLAVKCLYSDVIVNICIGTGLCLTFTEVVVSERPNCLPLRC